MADNARAEKVPKTGASSDKHNEISVMQVFKDKMFNALIQEVQKLKEPISQEGDMYSEIVALFQFIDSNIGDIRHNSTGRDYNLNSADSREFFGSEVTSLLYRIMNKLCYAMSNSIQHNNCSVLRYVMVMFRRYLGKYCEERKNLRDNTAMETNYRNQSDTSENEPQESMECRQEFSANFLENICLQYVCKFLLCFVDVSSKKADKPRRKRVIHAVICNLKNKLTKFINTVIPKVLKGDRFLVDGANNDRLFIQRYNTRKRLIATSSRFVGQFHQLECSASFMNQEALVDFGTESSLPIVSATKTSNSRKSFMHISMQDASSEKGKKWTPVWDNDINFVEHLLRNIKQQVELLETEIGILREVFFSFFDKYVKDSGTEDRSNMNDDEEEEQKDEIARLHTARKKMQESHLLLKKGDNDFEYSFDMSRFIFEYKEEEYTNVLELKGLHEHPALSVKLRIISNCSEGIIKHVEWENKVNKPQLLRPEYIPKLRFTLDSVFSNIKRAVETSDVNIAMVSSLSHAEFLVLNPIQCSITNRPHVKSAKMMESFGTWAMAHIVFAGMATFDYDLLRTVKTAGKARGTMVKGEPQPSDDSEDGTNSDDDSSDVGTLAAKLNTLGNELCLPSVDDIHSLLKSAFLGIANKDLGLLQSILRDMLVLQPWTRNLDAKEEKSLSRMEAVANRCKYKVVDLTADTKENSDDDVKNFGKLKFSALPTTATGTKKQALQQSSTPVSVSKIGTVYRVSSSKKGTDMDEEVSSIQRSQASKQTKSPPTRGVVLGKAFEKDEITDTDTEEENDLQAASSEKSAKRALVNTREDYDDDGDDFDEEDKTERAKKKKKLDKTKAKKSKTLASKPKTKNPKVARKKGSSKSTSSSSSGR